MTNPQSNVPAQRSQDRTPANPLQNIRTLLDKSMPQLKLAASHHLPPERLMRVAMTTIQKTPKLLECDPITLLGAVIQCGQLGLEPDGLTNRAHLIPRWNSKMRRFDATFMIGYKGLIELAIRSGEVRNITPREVREGDVFDFSYGLEEKLVHKPTGKRGDLTHVYAVVEYPDGNKTFTVMSYDEIEEIRARSSARDAQGGPVGPWATDYTAMALKTVIRKVCKFLPLATEKAQPLKTAIGLDERAEAGLPQDLGVLADTTVTGTPAGPDPVSDPQRETEPPSDPNPPRDKVHPRPDDTQIDALLHTKPGKELAGIADKKGLGEKDFREYLKDRCMETAPARLFSERFEEIKAYASGGFNA